jgi:hypothetical protein
MEQQKIGVVAEVRVSRAAEVAANRDQKTHHQMKNSQVLDPHKIKPEAETMLLALGRINETLILSEGQDLEVKLSQPTRKNNLNSISKV